MQNNIEKALIYILSMMGIFFCGYAFFNLYLYFSPMNKNSDIIIPISMVVSILSFLFVAIIVKGRKYEN